MSDSTPKLKKGVKRFASTTKDKASISTCSTQSCHRRCIPHFRAAFKLAADMILDSHQVAQGAGHNDKLLFPVLYLYRHCIELQLKDLVAGPAATKSLLL